MTPAPIAHQFDDGPQQRYAAALGMWLFLASEALIFAVLLTAYCVARASFPEAFAEAGHHLYKWIGIGNTAILLISSAAMALAVESPDDRPRRKALLMLATAAFGACFLAIKGVEYTLDIRESLLPGISFEPGHFHDPPHAALFLTFYWIMTGVHAFHVLAGVLIIATLAFRLLITESPPALANTTHGAGLYWHFVDIVWLFLLPLLYLNP